MLHVCVFVNNKEKKVSRISLLPWQLFLDSPVVGAVGEMAAMKRRKLCCSSSAIQTRLDPSSLLEERSETPIVFVCFFCVVGYPPNWGKQPRYIDRIEIEYYDWKHMR